jgi:apolipoprotein N-acyltransferase
VSARRAALLISAHAVLFAAALHHPYLSPFAWVSLVPEVILIREGSRRQAILGTGIAHFLHGLFTVYWLAYTIDWSGGSIVPVKETMGAGPAPWIGTAMGFGLYGLFYGALARVFAKSNLPASIWLPLLWTGIECIQGKLFFFAFPWMWLGHSQFAWTHLVQIADLGGALAVSFVVAGINGMLADLEGARRRKAAPPRLAVVPAAILFAALGYGILRLRTIEVVSGPRILAVQPFFPQSVKNATEYDPGARLRKMAELTRRGLEGAGRPPDLIVWPETIVPRAESDDPALRYASIDKSAALRGFLRGFGAPMLVGSVHSEIRDGRLFEHNSAFLLAEGEVLGRYDKMFLAPISEETPFYETFPALHRFLRETFVPPDFTQFERGKEAKVFRVGAWNIGPSICFDITFSEASNGAARNGAEAIVNISNYAWFEDSIELDLARAQTMFRAIETRRGIASVVNGGITHFVDPLGRIRDLTGPHGRRKLVEGTLLAELRTSRARPLFVRLPADAFGWACFALALGLGGVLIARRRGIA